MKHPDEILEELAEKYPEAIQREEHRETMLFLDARPAGTVAIVSGGDNDRRRRVNIRSMIDQLIDPDIAMTEARAGDLIAWAKLFECAAKKMRRAASEVS